MNVAIGASSRSIKRSRSHSTSSYQSANVGRFCRNEPFRLPTMEQEEVRVIINNSATRGQNGLEETDCLSPGHDRTSILSGLSGGSKSAGKEEERATTFSDVRAIMPTVIILIVTVFIVFTIIPYSFYNVIKQWEAVDRLQAKEAESQAATDFNVPGMGNHTSTNSSSSH